MNKAIGTVLMKVQRVQRWKPTTRQGRTGLMLDERGKYIKYSDFLRIVAEFEKALSAERGGE